VDWGVFWQAAGAIATTLAVIVALWQTRYANKKKLKLAFHDKVTMVPASAIGTYKKNTYVTLDVANIGNRKINITNWFIKMPNGVSAVICPDITPAGLISLPKELDIEENIVLPWSREKFIKFLKDSHELSRNKKLTFCVADTTGSIYSCKTTKTVQRYIDEN